MRMTAYSSTAPHSKSCHEADSEGLLGLPQGQEVAVELRGANLATHAQMTSLWIDS